VNKDFTAQKVPLLQLKLYVPQENTRILLEKTKSVPVLLAQRAFFAKQVLLNHQFAKLGIIAQHIQEIALSFHVLLENTMAMMDKITYRIATPVKRAITVNKGQ